MKYVYVTDGWAPFCAKCHKKYHRKCQDHCKRYEAIPVTEDDKVLCIGCGEAINGKDIKPLPVYETVGDRNVISLESSGSGEVIG